MSFYRLILLSWSHQSTLQVCVLLQIIFGSVLFRRFKLTHKKRILTETTNSTYNSNAFYVTKSLKQKKLPRGLIWAEPWSNCNRWTIISEHLKNCCFCGDVSTKHITSQFSNHRAAYPQTRWACEHHSWSLEKLKKTTSPGSPTHCFPGENMSSEAL